MRSHEFPLSLAKTLHLQVRVSRLVPDIPPHLIVKLQNLVQLVLRFLLEFLLQVRLLHAGFPFQYILAPF